MVNGKQTAITWQALLSLIPVLLFLAAIFGAFSAQTSRIDHLEERVVSVFADVERIENMLTAHETKTDPILTDIQVRLAEIQRDLVYIKRQLPGAQ